MKTNLLGSNQPSPAVAGGPPLAPWTDNAVATLVRIGATRVESVAVMRDMAEAGKIPPSEQDLRDGLSTLRQVVDSYLKSGQTSHPAAGALAAERKAANEEQRAAKQREALLEEEQRRRSEAERREAETIAAARAHERDRALVKAATTREDDTKPD